MNDVLLIVVSCAALLFAVLAVVLILALKKKSAAGDETEVIQLRVENQRLKVELAKAQQSVVEKEKACNARLEDQNKTFQAMTRTLEERFANLAAATLETKSKDLTTLNKNSLDETLKPLKEQMEKFQQATQQAQVDHRGQTIEIHKDVEAIRKMADDLAGFSKALKGGTKTQGDKGEDILAEKLRQAGLEEGVNFVLQRGTHDERPDAQVGDAQNRWLIIDSKVSLTNYIDYCEAEDTEVKKDKLKAHVVSVRNKIDELARKNYPKVFAAENPERDYLPVTAMFVPFEAALRAALEAEPSLWQRAMEANIIIITPLTLIAYLRLVYLAWQHEKAERNQQEIINTAKELLTRMNTFLVAFEKIGKTLETLQSNYGDAAKTLVNEPGAHTIAKSAQKLIDLNVKLENRRGQKLVKAKCLTSESVDEDTSEGE